ncbi:MAG: PIG-L family deacetylase [Candidatus Woesearchaeota archaeon]|nr:PIG-L family deacetylase [Candidatus Woesearchaeota archaeon]
MPTESIIVICSHSDDQIFGPGGTLAKYAKEGKEIYTIVLSYGESSHPHFQRKVAVETRVDEAKKADEVIGGKGVVFIGLKEGKFRLQAEEKNMKENIKKIIKKIKPSKIFTHTSDDPHKDHRETYQLVMEIADELSYKGDVYSFAIWNPLKIGKRNLPKLVVDISDTFKTKINALNCFESQKLSLLFLLWSVYLKAIVNGLKNKCRFAEVFWKER